jgi:hypothetical protein
MFLFLVKTLKYTVNYYLVECFIFNKYILIQKGLLNILICDRKLLFLWSVLILTNFALDEYFVFGI